MINFLLISLLIVIISVLIYLIVTKINEEGFYSGNSDYWGWAHPDTFMYTAPRYCEDYASRQCSDISCYNNTRRKCIQQLNRIA